VAQGQQARKADASVATGSAARQCLRPRQRSDSGGTRRCKQSVHRTQRALAVMSRTEGNGATAHVNVNRRLCWDGAGCGVSSAAPHMKRRQSALATPSEPRSPASARWPAEARVCSTQWTPTRRVSIARFVSENAHKARCTADSTTDAQAAAQQSVTQQAQRVRTARAPGAHGPALGVTQHCRPSELPPPRQNCRHHPSPPPPSHYRRPITARRQTLAAGGCRAVGVVASGWWEWWRRCGGSCARAARLRACADQRERA
jgi:hypothetical protein